MPVAGSDDVVTIRSASLLPQGMEEPTLLLHRAERPIWAAFWIRENRRLAQAKILWLEIAVVDEHVVGVASECT